MRARKVDRNHGEILRTLRECGWLVKDTHELRRWVDATVSRGGHVRLIEIKADGGMPTEAQLDLVDAGWPIRILRNVDDAINLR